MDLSRRVWLLRGVVQNYAWGKIGSESAVAQLARAYSAVDETKPYAELWMGTHVNGHAQVLLRGKAVCGLSDLIAQNPSLVLGERVVAKFGANLPYLLKVLSIAQPLSLQAHPDLMLAKELHARYPDLYKDGNHKPEIAIPVTPMRALCGFRSARQIAGFMSEVAELKAVIGAEIASKFLSVTSHYDDSSVETKAALKEVFGALMGASDLVVKENLFTLLGRLKHIKQPTALQKLILEVSAIYPGDIGLFGLYFLNFVELDVGEAIFLAANEPHAYISGNCIECMATSDNVVRAGLTPKFKDVATLVRMLTYNNGIAQSSPGIEKIDPEGVRCSLYQPPRDYPEFRVERFEFPANCKSLIPSIDGAAIVLVYSGKGSLRQIDTDSAAVIEEVSSGSVLFVFANTPVSTLAHEDAPLVIFRASPNFMEVSAL